jgi:phosphate transport system protein
MSLAGSAEPYPTFSMQTHFEKELSDVKEKLLLMASHAEAAIQQSVQALIQRDHDLAVKVRESDEVIDRLEIEVDELAIKLLAKAPLASDLRLITVAMKVSQNLERVGDEATKIAKRARDLSQELPLKTSVDIPRLAELSLAMLRHSLDAFVRQDPAAARALIPQDKAVDALNREIHRQLVEIMTHDPQTIMRCLHLMVAAKSLERTADHAKNIAEEVVYLCEAADIRHAGHAKPVVS